jgi:hypothetical protein
MNSDQLEEKLEELEWKKLELTYKYTFAIPDEMGELWDLMTQYDLITVEEDDEKSGCSEGMVFAFDFLLNDRWGRDLGSCFADKDEKDQQAVRKFHQYLRTKFTADEYWEHLLQMLPNMADDPKRKHTVGKIWC